jgi:hypothetical protein
MCAPRTSENASVEPVEGTPAMPAEPAESVETRAEVAEEEWAAVRG